MKNRANKAPVELMQPEDHFRMKAGMSPAAREYARKRGEELSASIGQQAAEGKKEIVIKVNTNPPPLNGEPDLN